MTSGKLAANPEFGEYDSDPDERGAADTEDDQRKRQFGPSCERIKELAKPKEPFIAWHTCVGPHVRWGTQDSLWPVSPRATLANASPRIETLATPKRNFQAGTVHEGRPIYYYSAGRPSVIWSVSEGAKNGAATERVQQLAQHKHQHSHHPDDKDQFVYSCGRVSPIWNVQPGAAKCQDRARTTLLAHHREYHPDFQEERSIQSQVTQAAKQAVPSDRVTGLAQPRNRNEGPFRDPQWPVSEQAKSTVASARCAELAQHKPLAEGFQHARNVEWPVSKAAKAAHATPRVEELSQPITRDKMDTVQFDPNAFTVKSSALKGVIPKRIEELAQPVNR